MDEGPFGNTTYDGPGSWTLGDGEFHDYSTGEPASIGGLVVMVVFLGVLLAALVVAAVMS